LKEDIYTNPITRYIIHIRTN